jgi:hypothetical protein
MPVHPARRPAHARRRELTSVERPPLATPATTPQRRRLQIRNQGERLCGSFEIGSLHSYYANWGPWLTSVRIPQRNGPPAPAWGSRQVRRGPKPTTHSRAFGDNGKLISPLSYTEKRSNEETEGCPPFLRFSVFEVGENASGISVTSAISIAAAPPAFPSPCSRR